MENNTLAPLPELVADHNAKDLLESFGVEKKRLKDLGVIGLKAGFETSKNKSCLKSAVLTTIFNHLDYTLGEKIVSIIEVMRFIEGKENPLIEIARLTARACEDEE